MSRTALSVVILTSLATLLPAQVLNATITPNPAPLGVPINIDISDAQGSGVQLPTACVVTSVTMGGPVGNGPEVLPPILCLAVITPIPSCASGNTLTGTWTPFNLGGPTVSPGRYWINITFWDANFTTMSTESFPVTIEAAPTDPRLTEITPALIGTAHSLQVSSPNDANAFYVCATSLTTNTGIFLGPDRAGIDMDALFALSFPFPLPGVFINYQSFLDQTGTSPIISINLPPDPSIRCLNLHTQCIIAPTSGGPPRLTNTWHSVVQ